MSYIKMSKQKKGAKVKDSTAKFYKRSGKSGWEPIPKGFGGNKSDVSGNDFGWPLDSLKDAQVLFSDGRIVSRLTKSELNLDASKMLKTLTKQQNEAEKQKS